MFQGWKMIAYSFVSCLVAIAIFKGSETGIVYSTVFGYGSICLPDIIKCLPDIIREM